MTLIANWAAPSHIRALTTTRTGGFSKGAYTSNNLGLHVEDSSEAVVANRQALQTQLHLPHEPIWLNQTHSTHCVVVENSEVNRNADAAITRNRRYPLAIMTADCLPILICDQEGTEIAAIHAGWRGLVNGIIENTLSQMYSDLKSCIAWIGPSICKNCYETGEEVFDLFNQRYSQSKVGFHYYGSHLHANLPYIAELILLELGVGAVYQSQACTFESVDQFYSYRRSPRTGRMATLIWFQDK